MTIPWPWEILFLPDISLMAINPDEKPAQSAPYYMHNIHHTVYELFVKTLQVCHVANFTNPLAGVLCQRQTYIFKPSKCAQHHEG